MKKSPPAKAKKAARTKEAPAAAGKALVVPGYDHFGGRHHETANLANILTHLGVTCPHTGKPYTEAMLLGIGGGIGCGYFLFEMCGDTILAIGGRHLWHSTKAEFLQGICGRLGLRVTTKEAGGRRAATDNLHEALERGRPAVAWAGLAGLPWHALPIEWLKAFVYCVVVYGFDAKSGRYLVADRSRKPLTIGAEELMAARLAIVSLRGRTLVIDTPAKPPDPRRAAREGIQACVHGMTKPPIANFGLSSLAKWADLVTNPKDEKGWPRVLPAGRHLYQALTRMYQGIEIDGTGGGAFRTMYAEFLDEAGDLLDNPKLKEVAKLYREASAAWTDLAAAALPDAVPFLKETRDLVARRNRLFEEKGAEGIPEMTQVQGRLAAMKTISEKEFPLSREASMDLLSGLKRRIENLHRMESGAIEALRAAAI